MPSQDRKKKAKQETKPQSPPAEGAGEKAQIDLPDANALSLLAAQYRFAGTANDKFAVSAALGLWREAKALLDREQAKRPFSKWKNYYGMDIPLPERFPVSFDEMLRQLMPQTKNDDRIKHFRHYLADNPSSGNDGKTGGEKWGLVFAGEKIERYKTEQFGEQEYWLHAGRFLLWWKEYLSNQRSESGAKGGRKRKPFDGPKVNAKRSLL